MPDNWMDKIALAAAIILPLFNIPLIWKVIQRKSSADISLCWALGVWICIVLMTPSAVKSPDVVWRTFSYLNIALFTVVMFVTVKYRSKCRS